MKKIALRIVQVLGALVVLAVLGIVVKFYVLSPKMHPARVVTANPTKENLERGRYLVENVTGCLGCHSPIQESQPGEPPVAGKIGGGRTFNEPNFPGKLRSPNISSDKDDGIGAWTDGEILRAMREGVSRNGRTLFPQMPYPTYAKTLSDDDALAIIAFLRTLPPVKNAGGGPTEVKFPVSMFIRGVPQPLLTAPPPAPPESDKKARGEWLLQVASCHDCHDTFDARRQPIAGKALGGGAAYTTEKGTFYAPNISSDPASGLGAYSDADLRRVFDTGVGKAGRPLYVMPWSYYSGMTAGDKEALIFALRQQPPVQNLVPPSVLK